MKRTLGYIQKVEAEQRLVQQTAAQLEHMRQTKAKTRERLMRAAEDYAAFDRSDPFALSRARTHIDCGIAVVHRGSEPDTHVIGFEVDAGWANYSAEPVRVLRRTVGFGGRPIEYEVVEYRNVRRP